VAIGETGKAVEDRLLLGVARLGEGPAGSIDVFYK
jgi:hypothetical protein